MRQADDNRPREQRPRRGRTHLQRRLPKRNNIIINLFYYDLALAGR